MMAKDVNYKKQPCGGIGCFVDDDGSCNGIATNGTGTTHRTDTIVQSLWTKPILQGKRSEALRLERMRDTLFLMALSLAYAHRSGYRVHMHTDSVGAELLQGFGYDKLLTTLDAIPDSVPTELFAAGKFYAMRAEGAVGKVHVDVDVLLRKAGVLDGFYRNRSVDAVCQMEEDMAIVNHDDKIRHMHVLGYPASTRPDWRGSMNTGVVGFNNAVLAAKYMRNYFDALEMYSREKFDAYRAELSAAGQPKPNLHFDFVLEQIALSRMSVGYNVLTLVPTHDPSIVAKKIGYCHLQGSSKWDSNTKTEIKSNLRKMDEKLYYRARLAGTKV